LLLLEPKIIVSLAWIPTFYFRGGIWVFKIVLKWVLLVGFGAFVLVFLF
jgi:hypothetical protein